jgi:uncharacterized membrane protein
MIKFKQVSFLILLSLMFVLLISLVQAATLEGNIYNYQLEQEEDILLEIDTIPPQQYLSRDGTYSFDLSPGTYSLQASKGDLAAVEEITITESEGSFVYDLFLFPAMYTEDEFWDQIDSEEEEPKSRAWAYYAAAGIFLVAIGRIIIAKKKYPKRKKLFGKGKARSKDTEKSKISGTPSGGKEKVNTEEHKPEQKTDSTDSEKYVEIKAPIETESIGSSEMVADSDKGEQTEPKKELSREEAIVEMEAKVDQERNPGYLNRALDIIKGNDGRITQKDLRREMMDLSESKVSLIITELEHKGKIEKIKRGRGNIILLK